VRPPRASLAGRFAINVALIAITIVFGAPFVWVAVLAFDRGKTGARPWPEDATLDHFRVLFDDLGIQKALQNSLIVVSATTLLAVLTSALAGYGLSRIDWRQKDAAAYGLLVLYTLPLSTTMVPINDLANRLHVHNTYRGLILAQTAIVLPFLVWLMKGYFDAVPRSLEEAARLDGRSYLRAWFEILLPMVRPGLAVAAGVAFLTAWADVLLAVALVRGRPMAPVSLRFLNAASGGNVDAPVIAALGLVYMVPVMIVFAALRRSMARGFVGGGRTS
jgi:multiple sugar transport system permease protein